MYRGALRDVSLNVGIKPVRLETGNYFPSKRSITQLQTQAPSPGKRVPASELYVHCPMTLREEKKKKKKNLRQSQGKIVPSTR